MVTAAQDWQEDADCTAPWVDPEWFFPVEPDDYDDPGLAARATRERRIRAKLICAACPVARECLKANLSVEYGVFGGFDEDEREAIRTGRARPVRKEPARQLSEYQAKIVDIFRYGTSYTDIRQAEGRRGRDVMVFAASQHTLHLEEAG